MKPYSEDLRRKLLAACEDGDLTRQEIAALFHVSVPFVYAVLRRWRETGQLAPQPPAGGRPPALPEPVRAQLRAWLAAQPDRTLRELSEQVARRYGRRVSVSTLCRTLQRLDLPRKKRWSTPASATPHGSRRSAGRGGGRSAGSIPGT